MTDADQIHQLIEEAQHLPEGPARIAIAEEAIRHADALDDPGLRFQARMTGTSAFHRGGEPARAFVTFSWCLAEYDRDPGKFDGWDAHLLLWYFKWMVSSLTRFPEVPLERTFAVLDDMQHRYQTGGHSLHAVYQYRCRVADHIGDHAAAQTWYEKWFAAPRDENSDCPGCDPTDKVDYLANQARHDEAVALAEPVLAGQLTCDEQPQAIHTALLLPYLRTGRADLATHAHRQAYRKLRGNLANLAEVGTHVYFCALTGNEPRGLEILERHLGWLDRAPSPYAAMRFAAAGALVAGRLAGAGHGDDPVGQDGTTVAALADRLAEQATTIAAQFDARNGTAHQSTQIATMLAAGPIVDYLPLSPTAARTRPRGPAAPQPAAETPPDASGLLDQIERDLRLGRQARAEAAWQILDQRHPAERLDPATAARRAEVNGLRLADREDLAGAEAAFAQAAELYAAAGDEVRRRALLGRVGMARFVTGRLEQGAPLVEESATYLLAHAEPDRRAGGLSRLASLRLAQERPDDARAVLDEATTHAEQSADVLVRAEIAVQRAHCLAVLGHPERLPAAAAARAAGRDAGPHHLSRAALLHGEVLADAGELSSALSAFTEAVDAALDDRIAVAARTGRGQVLVALDRGAEAIAIDDLVEAVAFATERSADTQAAFVRFELAKAYLQAGRPLDAAETGEEAVAGLDTAGAQDVADRCRYLLTAVYRELGEPDSALALLDALVDNLDGFDNLPARGQVHEDAGDLLYHQDRDAQAAARYAAAAGAYGAAGVGVAQLRARRKQAAALMWADRLDEAVSVLGDAEELAAGLPAEQAVVYERAMLRYEGARIVGAAGRAEDALSRVDGTAAEFRSVGAEGEAGYAELLHGELLLWVDRPADAEPLLRAALAAAPDGRRQHAASLLATALAGQGREVEATALRAEHDLEDDP